MRNFSRSMPRGDFNYQCLVAPMQVSGSKIADLRDHYGLKFTKHMPFGTLRDEEGHMYSLVRAVNGPGSSPNPTKFLYLSTRVDNETLRLNPEIIEPRAATLFPKRWLENDTAYWSSLEDEAGQPWKMSASGSSFTWREEGLLDLQGSLIGTGTQWYVPGEEWGTFYVSQLYDVTGTCEGRAVKGIICLDQVWLPEGGAIHFEKDIVVNNKMHVAWWTFATIYKDGSWDSGSFMVGHENLGYAIFQNERGEIRCSTNIEGQVKHPDGSYFAESAKILVDGDEEWEFLPDPKGRMVDFVGGFPVTAQQEGRWRRVGDTREPDRWVAWGESDRRNGSARNVFGSEIK
ncbi:hypothetical protein HBA55_31085 [Pseudomaricurvus alkylphenolicus]|uniref:hypothetical protein n=1 Tax=Pseudomaricurvus alkylphenolicus TaxID=1306991 RepID=UPI00142266D1|nr:hypothetical protein [Pseudomaricurvus alkylphenolicus]NIB44086.1 hypothetical protein [Pseudomaricurvus alkylphenolicus]